MEKKIPIPLLTIIAGLIFIELFDRTFILSPKTAPVFSHWGLSFCSLQFRRPYRVSFTNSDTNPLKLRKWVIPGQEGLLRFILCPGGMLAVVSVDLFGSAIGDGIFFKRRSRG